MAKETSQLKQYAQIVARRYWIILSFTTLITGGTAVVTFRMKPVYEARALMLIEKESKNAVRATQVEAETEQDDYYQTQYEILRSWSLAAEVVKEMGLDARPEFSGPDPAAKLQGCVRIVPVPRTRMVKIAVDLHDPVLAADIANALAKRYIAQNLENRTYLSKEALKTLEANDSKEALDSLPAVLANPLIQNLKAQLTKLEGEWADLSQRYKPRYPRMVQLGALIEKTKAQIDQETRRVEESLKMQLGGQFETNNVRVIDAARVPQRPIMPRKSLNLSLGLLSGLLVGFALALFVDELDPTIHSQEDFERVTKLPFLGAIHRIHGLPDAAANCFANLWAKQKSPELEAFWRLHTAVSYRLQKTQGPTVMLVTSSLPNEGKSLVSANLARAYAESGEKVLLIDADMRNPSLHRTFLVDNEAGLSSYLTQGAPPAGLLRPTAVPQLSFLPSGPCPENPITCLTEEKLTALVQWGQSQFSRVVVDTAPLLPVADTLLWLERVHGVIFVVLSDKTKATLIEQALGMLKDHSAPMLGGVLNWPSSRTQVGYYYGYGNGPAKVSKKT